MACDNTDLKQTCNIEQTAIIRKLSNMQWLKSPFQLSDHARRSVNGKETKSHLPKSELNEQAESSIVALSTAPSSDSTDQQIKTDYTLNTSIDESNCIANRNTQSALDSGEISHSNMETVWNKDVNVASTLFPNSQSLVIQRLDEQEMMSMALAESIVTAQLQQFRLDEEKKDTRDTQRNESDDDTWSTVHQNLNDSSTSENNVNDQLNSQQPHDNNNNNAKSKAQSVSETKKGGQKTISKPGLKRLDENKLKKQAGSTLKETCGTRQCSKGKDDSQSLSNDKVKTSVSDTDLRKSSSVVVPKFVDKFNRVDGYNNRHMFMGKGARAKEQEFLKQHFPTPNNDVCKTRSSTEGLEDKSKSVSTKSKLSRSESEKKLSDANVPKKCHNVQITRTSSYNVQYNRTKALTKPQQRYARNTTRSEQESTSKKYTSTDPSNPSTSSTTEEDIMMHTPSKPISVRPGVYKKCDKADDTKNSGGNYSAEVDEQIRAVQTNGSAKTLTQHLNSSENTENKDSSAKPSSTTAHKTTSRNSFPNARIKNENKNKDESSLQRFRKDMNTFRRSTEHIENKQASTKAKVDDHKKYTDNTGKTYKANRSYLTDTKSRTQIETTKTSDNTTKMNIDTKTNKTDVSNSSFTQDSNASNFSQLSDSCTSNTNESITSKNTLSNNSQGSLILQGSANDVKTSHDGNSNNITNSTSNGSNIEAKTVKFSDSVQQISMPDYSVASYTNKSLQQNITSNPFMTELPNISNVNNRQQMENQQSAHAKNIFESNTHYGDVCPVNAHNTNQDTRALDIFQQKAGHSSQNMVPQTISNTSAAVVNGALNYQHPTMYVNQYSNMHTMSRKTCDVTNMSQSAPIPSSTTYNPESANLLQNELSNVLMHNNQTAVIPPPGFHGNPLTAQQNQWTLPLPDVLYFGNMMNTAQHPLNMHLQNSRSVCGSDFNGMQQPNYLQHPLFYMPPLCMQSWNPLLPYATPLLQSPQFANCNTFPNQVIPPNNLADPTSCPVSASATNNSYKHFHQIQQLDNNPPNFTAPIKLENYVGGSMQGYANKSNSAKLKENVGEVQMRASQYHRTPVPNEYQNCSQDAQLMTPFSYPISLDLTARNNQSNNVYPHVQHNKYHAQRNNNTPSYQRMSENYPMFQNNHESIGRKDYDASKNESECVPPMVSPRECMYYGFNYSRKTDNIANSMPRSDIKSSAYVHVGSSSQQHCVSQFHRNATYQLPTRDLTSKVSFGRGTRKTMEQ